MPQHFEVDRSKCGCCGLRLRNKLGGRVFASFSVIVFQLPLPLNLIRHHFRTPAKRNIFECHPQTMFTQSTSYHCCCLRPTSEHDTTRCKRIDRDGCPSAKSCLMSAGLCSETTFADGNLSVRSLPKWRRKFGWLCQRSAHMSSVEMNPFYDTSEKRCRLSEISRLISDSF